MFKLVGTFFWQYSFHHMWKSFGRSGANAKNANTEEGHINQRCGYVGRDSRAPELEEKRKIDISST